MATNSLQRRRDLALGAGAELFYSSPIELVRGEGAYLYDRAGRRYLDLYNNVPCVGHANPAVVAAMTRQQATLNVHSRYLHEGIVAFAERLTALNHDGIESVVFSCSGTEAVEVALMMARLVTGRRGIVCTDATYHGNSELVDSLSDLHTRAAHPPGVRSFPFPDRYRPLQEGLDEEQLCAAYLARVAEAIRELQAEGAGLAALILCPIFANEGLPDIPGEFMREVTDLVHREGGLVIADEVQSGHGRTGHWWGYQASGFRPDILAMGKPMGNGLPLAATLAPRDFVSAFRAAKDYFNTTAQTPLQAAVGMAVLDEIERLGLVANAAEVGGRLTAALRERAASWPAMGDVRGRGLFISVDLVQDRDSRAPDARLAAELSDRLRDRGCLVSYAGKHANVLKIRPPLVFTHEHAEEFLAAFDECVAELHG